jgi:hypothetical protein
LIVVVMACRAGVNQWPAIDRRTGGSFEDRFEQITGRVVLDGAPVAYFGVSVMNDERYGAPVATPFVSEDGSFTVPALPGRWHVVVAGPGFARHVVRDVIVERGQPPRAQTIAVERGHIVEGTVLDTNNVPVSGAIVRIDRLGINREPRRRDLVSDHLSELAAGSHATVSGQDGRYRFDDVAIEDTATVFATSARRASLEREVTHGDRAIDLVLWPTGTIEVVLPGRVVPAGIGVSLDMGCGMLVRSITDPQIVLTSLEWGTSRTRFEHVPIGAYQLEIPDRRLVAGRIVRGIEVREGDTTTVRIDDCGDRAHPLWERS